MTQQMLTKKQLAARWEISTSTLDRRVREKFITPALKNPIRFNLEDVLRAEGTEVGKLSPYERKRLEREKAELEQKVLELEEENRSIKRMVTNAVAEMTQVLKEV